MYHQMGIGQPCQSMSFSNIGPFLNSFATWPALLAFSNSTENLFRTSKFVLNLFNKIMERAYMEAVGDLWTPTAQATFDKLHGLILCNPCLQ
jgi:hypothetical protein